MALEAKKRLGLKEVWLLINPQNPHKSKSDIADFKHRAGLCEILAKNHPWLKVCYFEENSKSAYTAKTLQSIKKQYKNTNFIWLMGADNMENFHKWKNWQNIMQSTSVVIFSREGEDHSANYAKLLKSPAFVSYADKRVKTKVKLTPIPQWRVMFTPTHKGRATNIRKDIKLNKTSFLDLTPAQLASSHLVEGYVKQCSH